MAILIINKTNRHEIEAEEHESLLKVLLKAQNELWGPEVAIDSILVNGERVENLSEETLSAIPAGSATLELTLINNARDIGETIAEGREYLQKLEKGFMELSVKIRTENDPKSYTVLKDAMAGLLTMIDLFSVLRDNEDIPSDLTNQFNTFIEELNDKSRELNDAQENQDPILIADILEYEFVEVAQRLQDFLDEFSDYLPEE